MSCAPLKMLVVDDAAPIRKATAYGPQGAELCGAAALELPTIAPDRAADEGSRFGPSGPTRCASASAGCDKIEADPDPP